MKKLVTKITQAEKHDLKYYVDEDGRIYKQKKSTGLVECKQHQKGKYLISQFASCVVELFQSKNLGCVVDVSVVKGLFNKDSAVEMDVTVISDNDMKIFVPELNKYFRSIEELNQHIIDELISFELSIYELKKVVKPKITVVF